MNRSGAPTTSMAMRSEQTVNTAERHRDGGIAARLALVPLYRHCVKAAGRAWTIDAVRDQDQLLAAADHFDAFPYGLLLWDSSVVASNVLGEMGSLQGRRVLELGAGVGLAGLVARHLGGEVIQSDHAPEALALAARNAASNGILGITQEVADWGRWDVPGLFDLIIGSDILYDGYAHAAIAKVLAASLADDGLAVLTDPGRTATPLFIRDMSAAGWRVAQDHRRVAALNPVRPNETVGITVLKIDRGTVRESP